MMKAFSWNGFERWLSASTNPDGSALSSTVGGRKLPNTLLRSGPLAGHCQDTMLDSRGCSSHSQAHLLCFGKFNQFQNQKPFAMGFRLGAGQNPAICDAFDHLFIYLMGGSHCLPCTPPPGYVHGRADVQEAQASEQIMWFFRFHLVLLL